jgi:hypothetical protein
MFLSIEGEEKGFTQKEYKDQILRGLLGDICADKYKQKQSVGAFYIDEDYFVIEDGSKVYGKKDIKKNQGLYNKAQVEYFIYLINWPLSSPNLNLIKNI